ncbi:MAG: ribosomal protein [Bacteriovoracaceae bacterium]|nr:ribosomal protein [Bacteriovoracaceae bacterium]
MQVILKKDIPQLGRIGELIKVREGYARNFLIPRAYAVAANASNLKGLEHQKLLVEAHKKKVQKESQVVAEKINGTKISIERRFNESGKMFGTLTAADIVIELKKKNHVVDRRDVEFDAIKAPGTYEIKVRLPGDVYASVSLALEAIKEKAAKEEGKKAKTAKAPKAASKTKKAKAESTDEKTESEEADAE